MNGKLYIETLKQCIEPDNVFHIEIWLPTSTWKSMIKSSNIYETRSIYRDDVIEAGKAELILQIDDVLEKLYSVGIFNRRYFIWSEVVFLHTKGVLQDHKNKNATGYMYIC